MVTRINARKVAQQVGETVKDARRGPGVTAWAWGQVLHCNISRDGPSGAQKGHDSGIRAGCYWLKVLLQGISRHIAAVGRMVQRVAMSQNKT